MRFRTNAWSRTDWWYLLFLTGWLLVYAGYLFSFSLFDGFTTFSNDSASYMLLARKWSPWIEPDFVAIHTWPVISFPPGFAWLLALSAASGSLWAAHLFVSTCMLLSLAGTGWIAYRKLGWMIGGLATLSVSVLPGVVISSLGILSENLYLLFSLFSLWLFVGIPKKERLSFLPYLFLAFLVTFAILTRSIGVALLPAIAIPALLDKSWNREHRIASLVVVFFVFTAWWVWKVLNPQSGDTSYGSYLGLFVDTLGPGFENVLTGLWGQVSNNLVEVVIAFKDYLSLGHPGSYYFLVSTGILTICILSTFIRLFQLRPDAIYVIAYLGIVSVWPYPQEMIRFLHPLVILLLLQPFLVLRQQNSAAGNRANSGVALALCLVMIGSVIPVHMEIVDKRNRAIEERSGLEHSIDYLARPYDSSSERFAIAMRGLVESMAASAEVVPPKGVVAAVKHEFYALISGRAAVNLTALVSIEQQFCNLAVAGADWIFVSELTTGYNPMGSKIVQRFEGVATEAWSYAAVPDLVETSLFKIDHQKLNERLSVPRADCRKFIQHHGSQP